MPSALDDEQLLGRAEAWMKGDPDPETARELQALIQARDLPGIRERMAQSLEFGTAGLRGIMRAGSNGMNRAVVIRTTRALAEYLLAKQPDARSLPIIVGYDARLSSQQFAEDAVGVLLALGFKVRTFSSAVPTPLVAYTAQELAAAAAIVITASHNPAEYNGYKLYGPSATQIVPPMDLEIAQRISEMPAAAEIPRAAIDGAEPVPEAFFERYLAQLAAVLPAAAKARDFGIVYTPLHGVGLEFTRRALERFGFTRVHPVPEQAAPDGSFPTTKFPNPEEPGVLDRALELAQEKDAELVLANDPDADRLAVAVRTPSGRFIVLTGNQIGVLLADYLLASAPSTPRPLVVSTIVSSPMLASVAEAYGARYECTLTGFKWMWAAVLELERRAGVRFCFAYEEALGYSVFPKVRDKDGISAAVVIAELAAACRAHGLSLLDRLHALYRKHGLWVSAQRSITLKSEGERVHVMRALSELANNPPAEIDTRRVATVRNFASLAEKHAPWLPPTELIEIVFEDASRARIRPSGTEPKLKIYVDLKAPRTDAHALTPAEEQAQIAAMRMADTLAGLLEVD